MFEIVENGADVAENVVIGHHSIIKSGAKIGKGTVIGDFCFIDSNVTILENNHIGSGVHIYKNVTIGNRNHILDNTVIGLSSKHIGYHFYQGRVIIGNDNFIGNTCSIDCGNNHLSHKHPDLLPFSAVDLPRKNDFENATIIGNRCYILNNVTIHHNCRIGLGDLPDSKDEYDTVICTGCCLNGFVQVRKGCELSSGTYIREYASLGEGCFTGMLSHIVKDIPPFAAVVANRNTGICNRLVSKFELDELSVSEIINKYQKKRSGCLKQY